MKLCIKTKHETQHNDAQHNNKNLTFSKDLTKTKRATVWSDLISNTIMLSVV
jgi:hypothetical protein